MVFRAVYVCKKAMDKKRIQEIREKVEALLNNKCLREAMEALATDIDELQEWSLRTRFSQMKNSYDYLLDYMRRGIPDPGREKMYNTLLAECHLLNDQIALTRSNELSSGSGGKRCSAEEVATLHNKLAENKENINVTELLPQADRERVKQTLIEEHEQLLDKIFLSLEQSIMWDKSLAEEVSSLINDENLPANERATIISAATLSLITCFEPLKAITLIKTAANDDITLSTRAIIGLLIGLLVHESRLAYHPEVVAALQALRDTPKTLTRIATIQIQLLRCRETQKIDRKMREEIIPAMMKNPNAGEKMGIDIMREIEEENDKNPEWIEWMEKDDIKGKLEEMAKWQFEGADIYMSTFSQLKNYPFFNNTRNWFRPFSTTENCLAEFMPKDKRSDRSLLSAICSSKFFCNSDKYSFCFTFKQLPKTQQDILMQQLGGEEDIKEQAPDTFAKSNTEKEAEIESNQYIQDLYRFFKLSRTRNKYVDPFSLPLNMLESPSLKSLIEEPVTVLRIFNHLVDKEYYAEAVQVGKIYEKAEAGEALFYQEMGYCLQKEKDYSAAIDYYTRADIVKPDSLWTLLHIAQCYRLAENSDKALSYYLLAEDIAPDNISLLRQTGECFASLKQYDEAFARFFKIEYLKPGSINVLRAIAWCSFLTAKDEQARNYYKKILAHKKVRFTDYLNAAHVEWIMHNNTVAIELYGKAKELCGDDELFFSQFSKDTLALAERGVNATEQALLRDLIE